MTATSPADDRTRKQAFAVWVQPHLSTMERLAARLVDADDRDDLVQETLLRAWRRWETYDPSRGEPLAWLLGIAYRQRRRFARRADRLATGCEAREVAVVQGSGDLDLERAIERLSARQRVTVDLYYFVDLDVATIATVLGCAPGTVKATLHQARARLRVLLGEPDD